MDIHKPKPAHSWREFLIEIGTIICGILIALGLEQGLETLHWRHKIETLREAMRDELAANDGPQAAFRLATEACLDAKLTAIQAAAESGGERAAISSMVAAYPITNRTWDSDGLRAFLAADGGAHVDRREMFTWSRPYSAVEELARIARDERDGMALIQAIRPARGAMAPAELEALARAVQRLKADNHWIANYSEALLRHMRSAQIEVDPAEVRRLTALLVAKHRLERGCVRADAAGPAG